MTRASAAQVGLRYVPEATWGVTPSTPSMVDLRQVDNSLQMSKDTLESAEKRSDRQTAFLRHGSKKGQGDINFELSYGEYEALLEGALFGSWDANVLKAGTTVKSFTFEDYFADIVQCGVFAGSMIAGMSLNIRPEAIITGSFNVLSKFPTYSATPLDASTTPSQVNDPFDSFTGTLSEGGGTIAIVTGLDLSLANNLSHQFTALTGSADPSHIGVGRSKITGTLSAYFENMDMVDKFINETSSSLSLTLGSGTGTSYTILIPNIKYTGADIPKSGEDDIILSLPFTGLYDATEDTNLKITRIP